MAMLYLHAFRKQEEVWGFWLLINEIYKFQILFFFFFFFFFLVLLQSSDFNIRAFSISLTEPIQENFWVAYQRSAMLQSFN
jgi:hypothetical protein